MEIDTTMAKVYPIITQNDGKALSDIISCMYSDVGIFDL